MKRTFAALMLSFLLIRPIGADDLSTNEGRADFWYSEDRSYSISPIGPRDWRIEFFPRTEGLPSGDSVWVGQAWGPGGEVYYNLGWPNMVEFFLVPGLSAVRAQAAQLHSIYGWQVFWGQYRIVITESGGATVLNFHPAQGGQSNPGR